MRNVDDGEEKRKEKKEKKREKNGVFSGHYVIASSLPPERLHLNDDRWNAARSCQKQFSHKAMYNTCHLKHYLMNAHFFPKIFH